ncbi:MAG TPA: ATP-dependent RecD-like DNA helicase [Candidatus Gallacutalibacter pullicola]|uniref:ATP-dependent RecD2 DNA helicase n=1 Tax=Candidatus Gallacutalibacter pullicola TaxID=2840830 RepID=A0A9D1DP46_9FIRM|nr:ATP-dependent RecD-like DNA helicase [Candidatus Gallacutalibacter pullicola]
MQEEQLFEMSGPVEQIVFRNEKNNYTILELNNGQELVTVVGILPFVGVGEDLRVIGTWITHPTFGRQFKVQAFERFKPQTAEAILKYLSSGAIKGIGAATARKIVDAFGENTLEILEKEPERLTSIKGISRKKALEIADELRQTYGIREVILYLGRFGITPEEALRVWKLYGAQASEQIQRDPYCLCMEEIAIDFARADQIAQSLDRPRDDENRIQAGILYVLRHNLSNGHTCIPEDKLLAASCRLLEVSQELAKDCLLTLKSRQDVISGSFDGKEFIFLPQLYQAEVYAAGRILMMLQYPAPPIVGIEQYIATIEEEEGIQYAEGQKLAISQALSKGALVLTGGPGTGKTTTLNAIISILEAQGGKVFLAAPTGRAAKRMSELTGREAKTIHRLLHVEWDDRNRPVFAKNERDLLACDALVVDELSMVDALLFSGLLRAMPLGCRLILVGDCDQLPSVGPGNVLGDLIASGLLPVVQLKEIFRQSMKSLIVTNAHRIVAGIQPELHVRSSDFFFLPCRDPARIGSTVVDLYANRLPASYGYSPLTDIQVLSPGRKGDLGTMELNKRLQDAVNPPSAAKQEITIGASLFREGDKVMQTKNNYNLPWTRLDGTTGEGVFNGDVGILVEVDKRAGALTVQIDDKLVVYGRESAEELELAYAMTVHKSQGNEFLAVVIPMYPGPRQLYYRNLLYTAITRAKSLLVLVGREEVVRGMVENDRKTRRYSGLYYFLTGGDAE